MRIGFIVPALTREAGLLRDCVANIASVIEMMPDTIALIVIGLQGEGDVPALPPLPGNVETALLLLDGSGAGMARNRGLAYLEGRVDAVMFTDVSVRPGGFFLAAALPLLEQVPIVSAPVAFAATLPVPAEPATTSLIAFRRLVFRGFVWSTLFRVDAIRGLRFVEEMGPGTASPHQAGEDSRFLMAVWRRSGLRLAGWLPDRPVARLPRTDLPEKQARYARGQGWLIGRYPLLPGLTLADRLYFLFRALLFLANSFRFLLRPASRALGTARLAALWDGVFDRDRRAPSV